MAVKYSFDEHLIEKQYKAEQAMLEEFHAGNYTLENPLVKYNLYLINPLSAVVCFKTEETVAVTVRVYGKERPQGDMYHTFKPAKEHVLPIVGLYSNYENQVEIELYRGDKNVITIKTPDVFADEEGDPMIAMHTTPEYLQDQVIMVSPAGEDLTSAFDYRGDCRFHMNTPCVFDVKRLKNGNLIMGTNRLLRLPYYMSGLYEISPVGKIYKEYRLPGGYHHDEFELPDGNLLVNTDDLQSDTVEDKLALIDRKTGKVLKTYDYRKILPEGYGKSGSWSDEDWFHNNACWYDENTNSITLSGRHMDAMINIDFETGELNWVIGDPEGWPEDFVKKYFFTPIGSNFGWQYEQHANVITPNGDVMCFDNHHWGCKDPEKYLKAKDNYSRGVRYHLNMKNRTIEQVWEYGKDLGAKFFSPYICNVEYYNEGHYMVHSGGIGFLNNGEPSEVLPARLRDGSGKMYSTTIEVCNDVKLLEMQVHGNFYRAEKLRLYSDGINLELGKGQLLGELAPTKEFDIEVPAEKTGELLPESCQGEVIEEADRFTFNATFEKGQMVQLLVEQGEEVHRYFISTTALQLKAMCCATFMTADARQTRTFVNKAGLKGTYDLRVIVDDKEYETGVQVTC